MTRAMLAPTEIVDALLAGPRGRRLLLAYALEIDEPPSSGDHTDTFRSAAFLAAFSLDPDRDGAVRLFDPDPDPDPKAGQPSTPDQVAKRLARLPLPPVTAPALRAALMAAVDHARYWQGPDGEDVLAGTEPVRRELRRVAEHLAQSRHSRWWPTPILAAEQWSVLNWGGDENASPSTPTPKPTAAERLRDWHADTVRSDAQALRDRPVDPAASFSGRWWSTPPMSSSSRALFDGSPAGIWFVEDSQSWEHAVIRRTAAPAGDVYEIDGARAWADLCRRFPLDVSAEKRHDWYRVTGRVGKWVIPDWEQVANHHVGVHLTVTGYLSAAGTAIAVGDETASVIAGWSPDDAFWLVDPIPVGEPQTWTRTDEHGDTVWAETARQV